MPNNGQQILDWLLFAHERRRASGQSAVTGVQIIIEAQHYNRGGGILVVDCIDGGDAIGLGHAHIHHHHIGLQQADLLNRGHAIAGLANNYQVGLKSHAHAQRRAYRGLIIDQNQ
ncbi:MAG: hypothetical protein H0T53_04485 [Herpetosiphonaceae bacterium]|nr:hypothetical protein [Herpetosiphonaceae bacterium]